MPKNDDDILADEIGKWGAKGARIGASIEKRIGGASIGRIGETAGALGGALGGRFGAKLLPTDTRENSFDVAARPASVLSAATGILNAEGKLLSTEETSGSFAVKGLTHAGFFKLNPAIVIVSIMAVSEHKTRIRIQSKAKEGLIKQHTAEQALQRVTQLLKDRLK